MAGGLGLSGWTPAMYAELSDRQVAELVFAPRDKHGAVIPEWKLKRPKRRLDRDEEDSDGKEPTGKPSRAARELPSAEVLAVPLECFRAQTGDGRGIPSGFVLLWWQVWRSREGHTTEDLLARFWAEHPHGRPGG